MFRPLCLKTVISQASLQIWLITQQTLYIIVLDHEQHPSTATTFSAILSSLTNPLKILSPPEREASRSRVYISMETVNAPEKKLNFWSRWFKHGLYISSLLFLLCLCRLQRIAFSQGHAVQATPPSILSLSMRHDDGVTWSDLAIKQAFTWNRTQINEKSIISSSFLMT